MVVLVFFPVVCLLVIPCVLCVVVADARREYGHVDFSLSYE